MLSSTLYSFNVEMNFSQERVDSIQCLLHQREQINVLTEKNHSVRNQYNIIFQIKEPSYSCIRTHLLLFNTDFEVEFNIQN
jgi:hypothetical protein